MLPKLNMKPPNIQRILTLFWIQLVAVLELSMQNPIPYSPKVARMALHALESEDVLIQKQKPVVKPGKLYPKMRPSPSDVLPVEPLNFPLDQNSIPPLVELDTKELKKLLGKGYNPEFMSVTQPLESLIMPNGSLDYNPGKDSKGYPIRKMDDELKSLTVRIPGRRKKLKIRGERTRKRVLRYLSAYSYCPVQYQWKRMGDRFWPPWLKEGSCYQGRSCSIPPGMSCQPEKSTTLSVLWWHCKRKHCKWIEIQYPIITSCKCAC